VIYFSSKIVRIKTFFSGKNKEELKKGNGQRLRVQRYNYNYN
jgi:hypothetical protein